MADWTQPTTLTNYDTFVAEMKARDEDSARMFEGSGYSNIPVNTIRWNSTLKCFQNWSGVELGWLNQVLSVAGGGTGATDAVGARLSLGLGTMSVQNANTVNITGGALANIVDLHMVGSISAGINDAFDIGSNIKRFRRAYFSASICLPVGVDKFATS